MSRVSDGINLAVEVITAQIEHLRATGPLSTEDAKQLADLTRVLAGIEGSRVGAIVALIAGRKSLDKLPAGELAGLLKALGD
jgi:hypothetical protein